jgi:arylsulfatase A-like enzyme
MRKSRAIYTITFLAIVTSTCTVIQAEAAQPNFVFILVDDLGWTDLACYGSSFYDTPNIDKLAATGVKFTNAYAACPVCSPTRASIMTGKYPARLSTTDYFGAPQPDKWTRDTLMLPAPYVDKLPLEETTLPEMLKEKNYTTFFAGKWHLGSEGFWPEDQGFDVNKGGITRGGPYGGKKYFSPYGNPRLGDGPEGEHLPDRLATETVKFITDNKNKPFLVYLSFYSVHTPLISRADLRTKYLNKAKVLDDQEVWGEEGKSKLRLVQDHPTYAGMVEAMDQAVGKVLDTLDKLKLTKNTIIIFTSDNGGLSTSEGHPTSNLPLRAGKGWIYEGGIREPLLIRWPGVTKPGSKNNQTITSTDYFATIASIAKITTPIHDGIDISTTLRDGSPLPDRPIFWHYPHYGNQGGSPASAIRLGDWKLIEFFEDNHLELYNLKKDIEEKKDLAKKHPKIRDDLYNQLKAWQKEVGAKFPTHQ